MNRATRMGESLLGATKTDRYEQQADAVAQRVISGINPRAPHVDHDVGRIRIRDRGESSIGGGGARAIAPVVIDTVGPESGVDPQMHRHALATSGHSLDEHAAELIAPHVDHDVSRIRIHDDARAAAVTRTLNARAFTVGDDVVFAPGQYAPQSAIGLTLLSSAAPSPKSSGVPGGALLILNMITGALTSWIDEKAAALAEPVIAGQLTPDITRMLEENPLTHGLVVTTMFHRQNPMPGMIGPAIFQWAAVDVVEGATLEEARASIGPSVSQEPEFGMVADVKHTWIPPRHADSPPVSW